MSQFISLCVHHTLNLSVFISLCVHHTLNWSVSESADPHEALSIHYPIALCLQFGIIRSVSYIVEIECCYKDVQSFER